MKNILTKNAPPSGDLVQDYIDTAYDNVKLVADNLTALLLLAQAITDGDFADFLQQTDIDTLAELNALVLDATIASQAYVDLAVAGLYDHKGSYDAATNTPDLDTAPSGIKKADTYTTSVAGTFFTAPLAAGDLLIADQDDPTLESHWTIVNRNIDEGAFLQPGGVDNVSELINDASYADDQTGAEIKTAYELEADTNAFTDTEKSRLAAMEDNATADQSNTEIASAYNTVTPVVSQAAAEAGTSTTAERWTPERVKQAIAALGGGGGGTAFDGVNDQSNTTYEFTSSDLADLVVANNAAASTYDIPDSLGGEGGVLTLYNKGAGKVTIEMAGTDTLDTSDNSCEQYKAVTMVKIAATVWAVIGGSA